MADGNYLREFAEFDPIQFRDRRKKVVAGGGEQARDWARVAIRSEGSPYQCYRIFDQEPGVDIEADLAAAAKCFTVESAQPQADAVKRRYLFELRYVWRFLLCRYATDAAAAVDTQLTKLGEDDWWRWWRKKDLLLPRMLVGVVVGFVLIWSSGEVFGFLQSVQKKCYWPLLPGCALGAVYAMAVAEVQRRAGRIRAGALLTRAFRITRVGATYAGVIATLQYWIGNDIGDVKHTPVVAAMSGALALLLGMAFQHFWQEGSLGDPL